MVTIGGNQKILKPSAGKAKTIRGNSYGWYSECSVIQHGRVTLKSHVPRNFGQQTKSGDELSHSLTEGDKLGFGGR